MSGKGSRNPIRENTARSVRYKINSPTESYVLSGSQAKRHCSEEMRAANERRILNFWEVPTPVDDASSLDDSISDNCSLKKLGKGDSAKRQIAIQYNTIYIERHH